MFFNSLYPQTKHRKKSATKTTIATLYVTTSVHNTANGSGVVQMDLQHANPASKHANMNSKTITKGISQKL